MAITWQPSSNANISNSWSTNLPWQSTWNGPIPSGPIPPPELTKEEKAYLRQSLGLAEETPL